MARAGTPNAMPPLLTYALLTHASLLNMSDSELNRLYCSSCHCPRSIFQFPLKNGWRTVTCAPCLERQALRYNQKREEQEREEEEEEEQATGKLTNLFTGLQAG
jgi:hypothetical protein